VPRERGRPLGGRPLTAPAAFRGARIRVVTSPTSVLALRALGAVPRTNYSSQGALHAMTAHRLDGVESDAHAMYDNGYAHIAPYLPSNLTLFAKTETLVMTRTAFDGRPAADRNARRAAAGGGGRDRRACQPRGCRTERGQAALRPGPPARARERGRSRRPPPGGAARLRDPRARPVDEEGDRRDRAARRHRRGSIAARA